MIFWILIGIWGVVWMCGVICTLSEGEYFGKVFHKVLGWHFPKMDEPIEVEGAIIKSHCKFCDKEIQMDSQGNWY